MTAEVAILNRSAVALAADSAVTVTYWEGGRSRTRYFKGANKIFNISSKHPVGLMIYDAASLEGVPWEVISKAFRDGKGDDLQDEVRGYARHFFDFVINDGHLFPRNFKETSFISKMTEVVLRIASSIEARCEEEKKKSPDKADSDLIVESFERLKKAINADEDLKCDECKSVSSEAVLYKDKVFEEADKFVVFDFIKNDLDFDLIYELAVTALMKKKWTTLQTSGLVFAGYGNSDYFPQIYHYICYGILLGRMIVVLQEEEPPIDHRNVSTILPIAQSDMVDTFICGASLKALLKVDEFLSDSFSDLMKSLADAGKIEPGLDYTSESQQVLSRVREKIADHLSEAHTIPLRNVIGMLPIGELAELAETLISIESLKERVTRPTESVSGPIDVAVISKSDGFVWIKRKHYFDPALNSRFFNRQVKGH